jgi:hypothetical protein
MIIHDYDDNAALGPDGLVKSGHGIRVPMMVRDSVERRDGRGATVLHGGAGMRPGFCVHADASLRDAGERARAEAIAEMRDAWRHPSEKAKPSQSSDDDDYYPKIDDVRRPVLDAAEAERVCREARDAYIRDLQNAWRR